jgi:hypothetical protein
VLDSKEKEYYVSSSVVLTLFLKYYALYFVTAYFIRSDLSLFGAVPVFERKTVKLVRYCRCTELINTSYFSLR